MGVQVPLPAPLKNLVELWFNLLIKINSRNGIDFLLYEKERDDLMVNIIKENLDIEEALKKKLEFICSFCNTTCEIKKGSIRTIERTNLSYVEPHRIIIKGITFLAFNYETNIYIENLSNKRIILDWWY